MDPIHDLIQVHYDDWNDSFDEWLQRDTYRITVKGMCTLIITKDTPGQTAV
jgi:hypothetical protein